MGTYPPLWTPTGDLRGRHHRLERDDAAALGGGRQPGAHRGHAERKPNDGHASSDGLTGQGFGYYAVNNVPVVKISVDQFVAKNLVAQGVNRPIASLLLGANCNENGGLSQFYGGANGLNLPTIGSPLSAYNTVFGAAMPAGSNSAQTLLQRLQEHPRQPSPRDQRPKDHPGEKRVGQAGRPPRLDPAAREQAAVEPRVPAAA